MQNGVESTHILLVPTEIPCNPSEPSFVLVLILKCLQKCPLEIPGSTFCLPYGSWDPSTPWRTELRYICKDMTIPHDTKSIYIPQYNQWNNSTPNCSHRCSHQELQKKVFRSWKPQLLLRWGKKRWVKKYCGCLDGLGAAGLWKKAQADLL